MRVIVSPGQWARWSLDDSSNLLFARSAFYLGYSSAMLDAYVTGDLSTNGAKRVVDDAAFLGLNETDVILKGKE